MSLLHQEDEIKPHKVIWSQPVSNGMVQKLKTYQTSLGFYDLAIAAPSMKAALEAWGAGSNLFHQGIAKESSDPGVVAATMSKPGVVLRRPVGSNGPVREHADLPGPFFRAGLFARRIANL